MNFSSKLLESVIYEISQLPGIGKRSALRLALHILKENPSKISSLVDSIENFKSKIIFCQNCHNISDSKICDICLNPKRDSSQICVVQDVRDVMAIENTNQFSGNYHVLNGIISPIDGIGPQDLTISSLVDKVSSEKIKEVIFALSATMEGDTTTFYINKKISKFDIIISTIARGVPIGDEIEYADEVTLGRSILQRVPFSPST
tara:strand:- start:91823 stop:92434 length:612 start_codon:yes stop_codon:yes gene_type:complete